MKKKIKHIVLIQTNFQLMYIVNDFHGSFFGIVELSTNDSYYLYLIFLQCDSRVCVSMSDERLQSWLLNRIMEMNYQQICECVGDLHIRAPYGMCEVRSVYCDRVCLYTLVYFMISHRDNQPTNQPTKATLLTDSLNCNAIKIFTILSSTRYVYTRAPY